MELFNVAKKQRKEVIQNILKKCVSKEVQEEIIDNLNVFFEEGSDLIAIKDNSDNSENIGFFIASKYSENPKIIDELLIEEFFFDPVKIDDTVKNEISGKLKELKKTYKPNQIEVIVTLEHEWLMQSLSSTGFICELVKLEKILPNKKNLPDVIELIKDSIPAERINEGMITQVLIELAGDYDTEIIETPEDIAQIMEGEWTPIMVVLSFEPKDQNIKSIIDTSNQLLNWDDFEITYTY